MDQALRDQVLGLSELSNHRGFQYLADFCQEQSERAMNLAAKDGVSAEDISKAIGEIKGYRKLLSFVDSMVEARKDIQL